MAAKPYIAALVFASQAYAMAAQTSLVYASGTDGGSFQAAVDQAVAPFMEDTCHVGLSLVLIRGGETEFYDYGSTSREAMRRATPDSVYEIASVTKTFTGVLAAEAVLDHRMQLDGDFAKYLPGNYPNLAWHGHPITLRSLATHRSGLPRDLPDTDDLFEHRDPETLPYQLIARDKGYDRRRYLAELHEVQLRTEPGTEEVYSNLGTKVIGWGLENVYSVSFEGLVQQHILQPLDMRSSGFALTAVERRRVVLGYSPAGHPMPYHLRNAGAAYGLYSTTRDMARYVRWQLDESIPVIRLAHQLILGNAAEGEALIWHVTDSADSRVLWHGGGTFGTSSQVVLFPDEHQGYALLANDSCRGTEGALKGIAIRIHYGISKPH